MLVKIIIYILLFLSFGCVYAQAQSDKYPDIVAEVYVSDYFETRDILYGGHGIDYPVQMDINKILGKNSKKWFVSLPKESYIILQFTDNEIVDAPNQDDIQIVEHGCCQELADIYVSHDGTEFTYLGQVDDCDNTTLDLASISYKESVRFVKVLGLDAKCSSPGFDLVTVYGLPNANRSLYVGMEEVKEFFEEERTDKSLILENVYFDTDSYDLSDSDVKDLDKIIHQLKKFSDIRVHIGGHTDSRGSDWYNRQLSEQRAAAVRDYLIQNAVSQDRIEVYGYGETQPLRSNQTEEGRAINRRVELRRLN